MGGRICLIFWGPFGPQTLVYLRFVGGHVLTIIREALVLHLPLLDINGAKTMKWLRLLDKIVPDIVV